MTGLQIKAQAEPMFRKAMDSADALLGINEGISQMGDVVDDEVAAASYSANTWYSLPAACMRVPEVNINDDYKTIYTGYRISPNGQKILFADADSYIIHYTREPAALSALTQIPEMHVAYHKCLVTFLKGWNKYKTAIDDDEKAEGLKFMEQNFPAEVARIRRQLHNKPTQMIAQRHA